MYTVRIKRVGRPLYRALLGSSSAEEQKAALRERVMQLPLGPAYPFDIEAKLLRSVGVKPALVDVGAHSGLYSTVLEDIIGPAELFVFEPLPQRHAVLRTMFPRAHVFDLALSNTTALRHLRIPFIREQRVDARASFNDHLEPDQTRLEELLVRSVSLDSIAATLSLTTIGLIKIDVEGHELAVLEGAQSTIRRYRPLLLVGIEGRHHAFPMTDVFSYVEAMGYRGYYINPQRFELRPVATFDPRRDQNQSLLAAGRTVDYLQNFFFVPHADVRDFTTRAAAFLDAERRLARA